MVEFYLAKESTLTKEPASTYPKRRSRQFQQRSIRQVASQQDPLSLFNLLTSDELFDVVESNLPPHRERLFHPTETLSMFLSQTLSS